MRAVAVASPKTAVGRARPLEPSSVRRAVLRVTAPLAAERSRRIKPGAFALVGGGQTD
jgi:hypothetical protein